MKKVVSARIYWLREQEGGRRKPPLASTRYCPIVFFEDSTRDDQNVWSVDFICTELDDECCSIVNFSFLSDEAPYQYLYSGNKFDLFEGARLVAKGEIL